MTERASLPRLHALILAPHGRDSSVAARLVQQAGVDVQICGDLPELVIGLQDDVAFVLLTEEAIRNADLRPLAQWITDYAMPGMTGMQLAEGARGLRPGLPILLITGYADLPGGAVLDLPRLSKPYLQKQLAEQITALVGQGVAPGVPRVAH